LAGDNPSNCLAYNHLGEAVIQVQSVPGPQEHLLVSFSTGDCKISSVLTTLCHPLKIHFAHLQRIAQREYQFAAAATVGV